MQSTLAGAGPAAEQIASLTTILVAGAVAIFVLVMIVLAWVRSADPRPWPGSEGASHGA
jgi:hypothetical protein